jgi:hypothetical protein
LSFAPTYLVAGYGVRTLSAVLLFFASGCGSSTTLPYTPYSGVEVPASVIASVGCGAAPGQVFAYAVVLGDPSDASSPNFAPLPDGAPPVYASVFSCFANGAFAGISTSPAGGAGVELWIYAYDQADFEAAQASVPEFGCGSPTCPLSVGAGVPSWLRAPSTYVTTCTATLESDDHVLAVCKPLEPTPDGGGE